MLDQHLVADIADGSAQLAVAGRTILGDEIQDQRLPLAGDDPQRRIQPTGEAGQAGLVALDPVADGNLQQRLLAAKVKAEDAIDSGAAKRALLAWIEATA